MKKMLFLFMIVIMLFVGVRAEAKETDTVDASKFFNNKVMAHALGGYEGNVYNNTEEALKQAIQNGFKFIEVDMTLTADNKLICTHGFDEKTCWLTGVKYTGKTPTYKQFMTWKLHGKYQPIKASTLISYMRKYPELLLEIDLKDQDAVHTEIMISILVRLCNGDSDILDRILLQFYNKENYQVIDNTYHFKYYQYFTVKEDIINIYSTIDFCKASKITSVAINKKYITDENIRLLQASNIYILGHTVDDLATANNLLSLGIDIICTNFLVPSDIK